MSTPTALTIRARPAASRRARINTARTSVTRTSGSTYAQQIIASPVVDYEPTLVRCADIRKQRATAVKPASERTDPCMRTHLCHDFYRMQYVKACQQCWSVL